MNPFFWAKVLWPIIFPAKLVPGRRCHFGLADCRFSAHWSLLWQRPHWKHRCRDFLHAVRPCFCALTLYSPANSSLVIIFSNSVPVPIVLPPVAARTPTAPLVLIGSDNGTYKFTVVVAPNSSQVGAVRALTPCSLGFVRLLAVSLVVNCCLAADRCPVLQCVVIVRSMKGAHWLRRVSCLGCHQWSALYFLL